MHFDAGSLAAWHFVEIPAQFREVLLVVLGLNAAACYLFEKCFIGWYSHRYEERQAELRMARHEQVLQGYLQTKRNIKEAADAPRAS